MPITPVLQDKALGRFIQARRAHITPQQAGPPAGRRRRTPGLRREELAQLCGISVTWMTWIEQGRAASISPHTLARIAEALQLTQAERTYLFELAGKKDQAEGQVTEDIPTALKQAVHEIQSPAYLLDRYWTAVAWNRAAEELFQGWLDQPDREKNLLRFTFCADRAHSLIADWERRAHRLVAEFRADYGRYLEDPQMAALVEELAGESPVFRQYWDDQEVLGREGGQRQFNHPVRGRLAYEQVTLRPANRPDLKLVMLIQAAS
jgi:transcriptional regulator with XRE-family HTH domain